MLNSLKFKLFVCGFCSCILCIGGCKFSNSSISVKSELQKQIKKKFSASIFLKHKITKQNDRIFVQIRNLTCPKFTEQIENVIYTSLKQQKFNIVNDPVNADLLLQTDIVQCAVIQAREVQLALDKGYGVAISHEKNVIDSTTNETEHVYSIIADLQISERVIKFQAKILNKNLEAMKPWRQYQTRLAITKKLVKNKDFNAVSRWLLEDLAATITKIFTYDE